MPKYVGLTVPKCMGPSVPTCRGPSVSRIYRFARFHFKNVFHFYRDLCVCNYAFECRSVRLFCFHSSELRDLEFICLLYKAHDHLCARLWFCRTFTLRLSFYFPS